MIDDTSHLARAFLLRLAAYLAPFAVVVTLFTLLMLYLGESLPLALVVDLQRRAQMADESLLYRPQFGSQDLGFKVLSVNMRAPEVVAVGSSRVLQFRAGMLTEAPAAFYNAGGPAWQLDQVESFMDGLTTTPTILILGLDYPWFNAAYPDADLTPPMNDFVRLFAVNRSVAQALIHGRTYDLAAVLRRDDPGSGGRALGLRAIVDGHGFRTDGSEQYGDFLIARHLYQPTERERHMRWMENGEDMYVFGDSVDDAALAQLEGILQTAKARGITVVGVLPPYAPALYAGMQARGNHTYMEVAATRLQGLFGAYGFPFFNYSDGALFGSDDDFYDGWHGSERVYLRLFIQIAQALPDVFGPYTDLDALRSVDATAVDTWRVFGN